MRLLLILPIFMILTACQFTLPGRGGGSSADPATAGEPASANPIVGGQIDVTPLDDASAPLTAADKAPAAPPQVAASPDAVPQATPQPAPAEEAKTQPEESEPAAPPVVKSPAQVACERRKGMWSSAGGGSAAFCQTPTGDGGRICRKADDCNGYCLAKSNTCAPVTPMLGCHDILNEAGRMLTQCIN